MIRQFLASSANNGIKFSREHLGIQPASSKPNHQELLTDLKVVVRN